MRLQLTNYKNVLPNTQKKKKKTMAFQTYLIKILYYKNYYTINKKKTLTDNIICTDNLKINKSKT